MSRLDRARLDAARLDDARLDDARLDAYDTIRRAVLGRLERTPGTTDDPAIVRDTVEQVVDAYQRRAHLGETAPLAAPGEMVERILRAVVDLGPLTELIERADVEEIFIEGARVSYLDTSGRLRGLALPTSESENRQIIERLLATTDRHLDAKHPLVQARVLLGTARLTAAIPPIADCLSATLRRYTVRHVTLAELVARGSLDDRAGAFLWAAMQTRSRIAVSGEPGAGKTTMLAALLAAVPAGHCVRCCEEIRELSAPLVHGGYYETRPPALDGTGELTLRDLVKFVLAMRPDRIVVGEVRGAEAFELTRAVNAGCGFLCTVHANSAREALTAIVNAALMAGENVTAEVVRNVFSQALDLVVHLDRDDHARDGGDAVRREVCEITAIAPALGDDFTCEPLFVRDGPGRALEWTGVVPERLAARIERALPAGETVRRLLDRRGVVA
jgi:pilus assembly protein CpaF